MQQSGALNWPPAVGESEFMSWNQLDRLWMTPNLTDKKFPGNPTRSYRSRHPFRVVGEVANWQGHPPGRLKQMHDFLADLRRRGADSIIE